MSEKVRKVLNLLLVVVFVVSSLLLIRHTIHARESEESYEEAQRLAGLATGETEPVETLPPVTEPEPTEPPTEAPTEVPEPLTVWVPAPVEDDEYIEKLAQTDLNALRETNPDVVGWIMIPNTKINYPVVQGEDNQHYLKYTWNNKKSSSGAIFVESTNSPDLTDFRTIIYGHNMANSSMFGYLPRYNNQRFWETHPYVYVVTDAGVLRYEVYSTYKASVDSKTYVLGLEAEEIKSAFIQMTLEESEYDTGIIPDVTDRLLTLSTCTGNDAYRRVVHARLPMIEVEAAAATETSEEP